MILRYLFSLALIIYLVCLDYPGKSGMEYEGSDVKAVSHRINNSLSDFERSSYIDKKLNYFLKRWELNGASLAIVKDGRLVYAKDMGMRTTITK